MQRNKSAVFLVLLFTSIICGRPEFVKAQNVLDRILLANSMDSVSYDYLMGIRSDGKVLQQLRGTLRSSPEGFCDSNEERIMLRSGSVFFDANSKLKTLQIGFVKPDSSDLFKKDKQLARKFRDLLMSHPGSYVHVDSSGVQTIKINIHMGKGQLSDAEMIVDKHSYTLLSFSVKQQLLIDEALYDYELSAYNISFRVNFREFDTTRFFSVQNKRIIPASAWSDFKISYL